eukprot:TRINITY_DN11218_c0_g1_i1.p1 TRINITY_DN11218_c0_g1~~TRINITY_DN11218_c0_g1_i1.p1  ORF type:complete len:606 (-),score=179.02 TRINITY_DN11218_c0_g1_i1:178-1896(-)
MSEQVLPTHTNSQGIVFGGQIMAWMDICAGIASKRYSRTSAVTATMDDLHFRNPARLGNIVTIKAKVNRTYRTSMEVGVIVEAENTVSGDSIFVCSGYFIFVAVDGNGKPIPVPVFTPTTPEEKRIFDEALLRKELRQTQIHLPSSSPNDDITINKNIQFKRAQESATEMTQLVLVSHANTMGVTFGGQIMAWMESCALISAMRHARVTCMTVSVDSLKFLRTINVGDAVLIKARVNNVFKSSMEVGVKVLSENLLTGELKHCNSAFFTFMAMENGRPTPIPQILPESEEEKTIYREAIIRRRWRMERKSQFEDIEMNSVPAPKKLEKTQRRLFKLALDQLPDWEEMDLKIDGIRLWFKDAPVLSISEERMCCMRGEILVPNSPSSVIEAILKIENRLKWDSLFRSGKVVSQVNESTQYIHLVGKSVEVNGKSTDVDYSVLQCVHPPSYGKGGGMTYVISERSSKLESVPKIQGRIRGMLYAPSGFVVSSEEHEIGPNGEPLDLSPRQEKRVPNFPENSQKSPRNLQKMTRVVYVVRQMGNEALGAMMVETQWEDFAQSMINLQDFLTKENT